jgi:hypothetical protein
MTPLERITERIGRIGDVNKQSTPRPLLTLEEFFEGNNVDGSIWCNCVPPVSPIEAYGILKQIRSRPDVADVRVEISMFDDPRWPFSEVIYIVTSASPEQVKTWFPKAVAPDETEAGLRQGYNYELLVIPEGMLPILCWWD